MRTFAELNEAGVVVDMYRSDEPISEAHIDVTDVMPPVHRGCTYDGATFGDSGLPADVKKHRGFLFDGVMCSATAEDQNGVTAVLSAYQLAKPAFDETVFEFANGNQLLVTSANIERFAAEFTGFRRQFFNKAV